jgi:hypothetical protein
MTESIVNEKVLEFSSFLFNAATNSIAPTLKLTIFCKKLELHIQFLIETRVGAFVPLEGKFLLITLCTV